MKLRTTTTTDAPSLVLTTKNELAAARALYRGAGLLGRPDMRDYPFGSVTHGETDIGKLIGLRNQNALVDRALKLTDGTAPHELPKEGLLWLSVSARALEAAGVWQEYQAGYQAPVRRAMEAIRELDILPQVMAQETTPQ